MVPIIVEYWDTKRPSKDNPYYLPTKEMEDYNVKYTATHKWNEAELMRLNFNIVEISLEPRFWDIMSTIQNILRPQSHKEIEFQFQMIKDDWEQQYQAANSWKNVAEAILRQQKDKEEIATLLKQSKVSLAEKRPVVVSPDKFTNSKQDKKSKTKVPYEESIDAKPPVEVRKMGKPHTGVPLPEEMQKDREVALQATMNITGGKVSSPTKEGISCRKDSHLEKSQTFAPPGYQQAGEWYCKNCNMVHSGPLCPCPICQQKGHLYYHCPDRNKKESVEGAYQQMNTSEEGPVCETCGQKHEPPCTIGLKQQGLIQRQIKHNQDSDRYKEPLSGVRLETKATTPFCMYCGSEGEQHTPNCELLESMGPNEEPLCTFCGIMGNWADNCAE